MEIKIKYIRDIKPIEKISHGDWIDLRAGETFELNPGDYCEIPLGIAIELPVGYEALILPRSSTFKKWGILVVNSMGVIDESYSGDTDELHLPVIAYRKTRIYKNDRICQMRIIEHQPEITFEMVKKLKNENRGGFGSTGTN